MPGLNPGYEPWVDLQEVMRQGHYRNHADLTMDTHHLLPNYKQLRCQRGRGIISKDGDGRPGGSTPINGHLIPDSGVA